MQVNETLNEGLKRGYAITLTAAELDAKVNEKLAEAKARGYDTKVMRKVIALRKRDADDIAEEEAVLEMYKEALGM